VIDRVVIGSVVKDSTTKVIRGSLGVKVEDDDREGSAILHAQPLMLSPCPCPCPCPCSSRTLLGESTMAAVCLPNLDERSNVLPTLALST
jgi:hypothetical protein